MLAVARPLLTWCGRFAAGVRGLVRAASRGGRHTTKPAKGSLIDHERNESPTSAEGAPPFARFTRSLLEASFDPMVAITPDGRITDVNAAAVKITGVPREQLLGSDVNAYLTEPEQARVACTEVSRGGSVSSLPLQVRHFDGHLTAALCSAEVVRNDAGEVEGVVVAARDVTERQKAEESLRLYRELIDHANDAIEVVDPESGRYLDVNRKGCELHGYTREEYLALSTSDMDPRFAVPDGPMVRADQGQLRKAGSTRFEAEHRRKDGSVFPVEINLSFVRLDRDYLVAVVRDITQRRRAEKALQDSEGRLRRFYEAGLVGMFFWNVDGDITDANDKFLEMVGYTRDDLAKGLLDWVEMTPPEQRFHDERSVVELRATGVNEAPFEKEFIRKDGRRISVVISGAMLNEERRYGVSLVLDVTERRRAEGERRRLAAAIEQAAEGVMITDADGVIEYVNPAFEEKSGYSPAEAVGRDLHSFATAGHLDGFYRGTLEAGRQGGTWQDRFRWRRRDGRTIEGEATISPLRDAGGAIVNLVVTLRDVTEHVALEAQLRQAQKMEAVGRLAAGVAHDFNNLLQAMLSLTQLISSQRHDPERVATLVRDLEHEVKRGASLTRQLLLFSRREAARPERLDLNEVVGSAATLLRRLVRENVIVAVELARDALPIDADRGQLDQVLMNFAVNASDAMPEGGKLTIRTGVHDHTQVWLAVEDTGSGIPEEVREHIFEPFFTTKETGKGTGLGLSVAHGIVTQHGGRIEVGGRVGQGSTFTVFLPRAGSGEHPPAEAPCPAGPELPLGKGERVLVVEDEEAVREAVRNILASLGYETKAVASGEDAGKLPTEPPFDVLLTDLLLPGIAGPDLARGLKERWPALRVILMSGYTEDEVLRRGMDEASVRFLQKPFGMASLARELQSALEERHGSGGPSR